MYQTTLLATITTQLALVACAIISTMADLSNTIRDVYSGKGSPDVHITCRTPAQWVAHDLEHFKLNVFVHVYSGNADAECSAENAARCTPHIPERQPHHSVVSSVVSVPPHVNLDGPLTRVCVP